MINAGPNIIVEIINIIKPPKYGAILIKSKLKMFNDKAMNKLFDFRELNIIIFNLTS